jgi:hypothetical protein
MSLDYTALLKAHRDIPVLNTGINNTVTQNSTFPTKEHPSLLREFEVAIVELYVVATALFKLLPALYLNSPRIDCAIQ